MAVRFEWNNWMSSYVYLLYFVPAAAAAPDVSVLSHQQILEPSQSKYIQHIPCLKTVSRREACNSAHREHADYGFLS